ncbi:MAG: hypothetical protein BWK79_10615 [Beggiatoa sp. IS2]|nr:MAG: hypothetical protein BWK79_10615 [Beggiatoa sp. IS2]
MAHSSYNILSCDGGGMRGLTTALLIKHLDDELGILKEVDLFTGTSTGGIISVLLASGLSIDDVVKIYRDDGKRIFTPYTPSLLSSLIDIPKSLLETLFGEKIPFIFRTMYDSKGLEKVLKGTRFLSSNPTLKELEHKVAVTTFQLCDPDSKKWQTTVLHNLEGANVSERTKKIHEVHAIDAVLSTSAAPFYFPPHFIEGFGYCVDGGVFANNPCMATIAVMNLHEITPLANIKVLSIGTGDKKNEGIPDDQVKNPLKWGMLKWTNPFSKGQIPPIPLFELLLDGGTEAATRISEILLGEKRFCRADATLIGDVALDSCSKDKMEVMEKSVKEYIKPPKAKEGEKPSEWELTKKWVKTYWLQN